ncbi:hypothetical protein K438DRAFT_1857810 [Mycena galopus ATCC 62051]|nr:hypothetical protein K438DRAFT_1857810 [Mycena galopus ATCC 62051]
MSTTATPTYASTSPRPNTLQTPGSGATTFPTSDSGFAATSISTSPTKAKTAARVRFNAECVLIPESSGSESERKSHSLLPLLRFKSWSRSHGRSTPLLPPAVPPPLTLTSCLRSPSDLSPSLSLPPQASTSPRTLPGLCAINSSPISSPSSTDASNPSSPLHTLPLRRCCPKCSAKGKMEVTEEAFSPGALKVRRRVGGWSRGFGAMRGRVLDMGSIDMGSSAASTGTSADIVEGTVLRSGTGLAQVNRLVAELDGRRSRSPSATPTSAVLPTAARDMHGRRHGRASSLTLMQIPPKEKFNIVAWCCTVARVQLRQRKS